MEPTEKPKLSAEVMAERQRCVDVINYARSEGESDLRQVRNWIEAGYTAKELEDDRGN